MDKNTELFESACEGEKKNFQACVSSLLELQSVLDEKRRKSKEAGHQFTLNINESQVLSDWILDLAGRFSGHYYTLDRMNRNSFRLYRAGLKVREMQTPSLKRLLA